MALPKLAADEGLTRAAVAALSRQLGENDLACRARVDAFEAFERLPLPAWRLSRAGKRTLSALDLSSITPYAPQPAIGSAPEDDGAATCIVTVDGEPALVRLAGEIAQQGAYVAPLEQALYERPELVRPHLGSVVGADTNRFSALNAALRRGGLFVHVPKGAVLREPIELLTIVEGASLFPHLLIVAEEHAAVDVIERIASRANPTERLRLLCPVSEIVAKAGARVRYAALQQLGDDVSEVAIRRATAGRDANVELAPVVLGGDLVRSDAEIVLEGSGASGRVREVFFASGRAAFDLSSSITHAAPHSSGDALVLGAANGAGQAAFRGMISILEQGAGAESNLKSRALLLSPKAHVDAVPGLEIANNDVKAYHGATVGEIDEETLFFCQARGIALDEARRMIVTGFFSPVVDAIASPLAQAWLHHAIESKL
ncbi:MAG: Fe-S cluster assembly protein SufD [bacterium]|nr:Fe-S cluster assembly protein SufD [bacterium]